MGINSSVGTFIQQVEKATITALAGLFVSLSDWRSAKLTG